MQNGPPRPASPVPRYPKNASIILIGTRGVGKTTLARIASKALGWDVIDANTVFVAHTRQDVHLYISTHGWDAFRSKEYQILAALLSRYPTNKVIACSGGVVEHRESRDLLMAFGQSRGPVMHILREKDVVLRYLEDNSSVFPPFLRVTAAEAWDRREAYCREISSHQFVSFNISSPSGDLSTSDPLTASILLKPIESDFLRLLKFIHGIDTNQVVIFPASGAHTLPPRTYYLALTFPDLSAVFPFIVDEISIGVDCWEVRVDLLASQDLTFVAFQIATIRRYSDLPILFAVRTKSQGGRYPDLTDDFTRAGMYNLIMLAFKLGCEYVDLELSMPHEMFISLVSQRGHARVLGSWHDCHGSISWTGPETKAIYERAVSLSVSIVKIVNTAKRFEDNLSLQFFVESMLTRPVPLLAINMGPEGKISGILNPIFSPISHPLLPYPSAPGQMSYAESQQTLYLTGLLPQRTFYLFGSLIARSLLPLLHRTTFKWLNLPHTFIPISTNKFTLEEVEDALNSADFGGAAITIPHEVSVMALCKRVSYHARLIGAIDTLIPCPTFGPGDTINILGENTYWVAIHACLTRHINTSLNGPTCRTTALVLGAGGASRAAIYSLYRIGVSNMLLWNHTMENGVALAKEMRERLECADGGRATVRIGVLMGIGMEDVKRGVAEMARTLNIGVGAPGGLEMPSLIISTIYESCIDMEDSWGFGDVPDIGLRADVLELSAAGGVAVELAYQPRVTPLLKLVAEVNQRASTISTMVSGSPRSGTPVGHAQGLPLSSERTVPTVKVEQDEWDSPTRTPPSSIHHTSHPLLHSSSSPYGALTRTLTTPWVAVEGIEVLLEQAFEQTRLWSGRRAPKKFVRESVMKEFENEVDDR